MLQYSEILLCGLSFGVRMPFQCCLAYGCFVALFRKLLCFKDQERRRRPQPCRNDRDSCNEQPVFDPNGQGFCCCLQQEDRCGSQPGIVCDCILFRDFSGAIRVPNIFLDILKIPLNIIIISLYSESFTRILHYQI